MPTDNFARTVVIIGLVLTAGGVLSRGALLVRDAPALTSAPFEDDSYYSQSYARNLWNGRPFSLNGVDRGNAFHPLYTLMCAPLHGLLGPDKVLPIRGATLLNIILFLATLAVIRRCIALLPHRSSELGADAMGWLAAGLYAVHAIAFLAHHNVMHTGLQLLAVWLLLHRTLLIGGKERKSLRDYAQLGMTLLVVCLARVDGAILVAGYAITFVLARHRWQPTLGRLVVMIAPSAIAIVAWFALGYAFTGSFVPTGGAANTASLDTAAIASNAQRALNVVVLSAVGLPHSHPPEVLWSTWWDTRPMIRGLLGVGAALGFLALIARSTYLRKPERAELREASARLAPLLVGVGLLVAAYVTRYSASYFFQRYFVVMLPPTIGITYLLVWQALDNGFRKPLLVPLVAYVGIFGLVQLTTSRQQTSGWWQTMTAVMAYADDDDWVAAPETGILGYYHERTINLDGKTNVDAMRARLEGRLESYILERKPDFIVDRWGYLITEGGVRPDRSPFHDQLLQISESPAVWKQRDSATRHPAP